MFKSVVYGFTIGVAGCYQGYNTKNGTEGVGKAANSAVVLSMLMIFLEELIIVQFINEIR
jgi:phospholipid/cholesterol/gamma-HCH transport system permease protein